MRDLGGGSGRCWSCLGSADRWHPVIVREKRKDTRIVVEKTHGGRLASQEAYRRRSCQKPWLLLGGRGSVPASSRSRTGIKSTTSHTTQNSVRGTLEGGKRGEKWLKVERSTPQRLTKVMRERNRLPWARRRKNGRNKAWNRDGRIVFSCLRLE